MGLNLSKISLIKRKKAQKRKGRGNASGRGGYCGRGQKGQRARSGGRGELKIKGLRRMVRSLPKLGGFKTIRNKIAIINLRDLNKFENDELIDFKKLVEAGLIENDYSGVKILAEGKLTKKLHISAFGGSAEGGKAISFSKKAKEMIVRLGGSTEGGKN